MAGESAGENLYARLCHCRTQLAKESKTPALDIATDVALQFLAEMRPTSAENLPQHVIDGCPEAGVLAGFVGLVEAFV